MSWLTANSLPLIAGMIMYLNRCFIPCITSAGTEVTRGFPLKPREGERSDHPHQIGMWLTYGNVDGNDFWGNGSLGLGKKNANGGIIKHLKVDKLAEGTGEGKLLTTESWTDSTGQELIVRTLRISFYCKGSNPYH